MHYTLKPVCVRRRGQEIHHRPTVARGESKAKTHQLVSGYSQYTTTLYEAAMDADREGKTSEGTRDVALTDHGDLQLQQHQKTSSSANQSLPKARVRSRKKDVNSSGGQDDSKRRCVSTACIGKCPSILYILDFRTWRGDPLADVFMNSLSKAQIKVRAVQASSS